MAVTYIRLSFDRDLKELIGRLLSSPVQFIARNIIFISYHFVVSDYSNSEFYNKSVKQMNCKLIGC